MALTRKPNVSEKKVQEIIEQGGRTSAESKAGAAQIKVQLRLSGGMLQRIDAAVHRRVVRIPRHTWFLEAIVEKLNREDQKS